ncbi:MAG: protein kinase [Polyangia bacterium]
MSDELSPGALIGARFLIESVAGEGGMGTVYRAVDQQTAQTVAIKVLSSLGSAGSGSERFQREARLLSSLQHPGIVSYITHGQTAAGRPFLVMEWLEGEDLSQRLARARITADESLSLTRQVAAALKEAHDRGVVHRDLKPSNIFLRGGSVERVALLDFGVARRIAHTRRMTRTGLLVGTPEYMAPEQARGARDIGPMADVFALGCVLFECLTGHPPFIAEHLAAVLAKILFSEPPPLRTLRPELSPELEAILSRMLRKDPAARYADAGELCRALDGLSLPLVSRAPSPAAAPEPDPFGGEQRLVSLLLAAQQDGALGEGVVLDGSHPVLAQRQEVADALVHEFGLSPAQAVVLSDGSLLVTFPPKGDTAMDQATLAAHCAGALLRKWPAARVVITTGRAQLAQRLPLGEALTRAGQVMIESTSFRLSSADILVDSVTAGLLGRRFRLNSLGPSFSVLAGEPDSQTASPLLLGRVTPFLGREQDLATLETTFAACLDEENARAVVVSGPAGIGKSRLLKEFLARVRARGPALTLLLAQAEPQSARSPYALLRRAMRRLCGVHESEPPALQRGLLQRRIGQNLQNLPPEQQQRVTQFIAELCEVDLGDTVSVALRAARQNPRVMDDQITRAFLDWLHAERKVQPVLIGLDDVQLADAASIHLLDTVLRDQRDGSLMLVALQRTDSSREPARLWKEHAFPLPLAPLSKRSCERLIAQTLGQPLGQPLGQSAGQAPGGDRAQAHAARIIELADGNPLFLEELIRAVAEGKNDELPPTLLAMVQARLDRLDGSSRRVLRAASVLGIRFWPQAVQQILGYSQGRDIEVQLNELLGSELIVLRRDSGIPNHPEYAFRHALIRDAAYAMLSDRERSAAHRAAGQWLEQQGEQDARILAEHFRRAAEPVRAVGYFVRAAEQSFARNDLSGVFSLVENGCACGATAEERGSLLALRTLARFFYSDMPGCLADGEEALRTLRSGQARWYQVIGTQISAAGLLGQREVLNRLIGLLSASTPEPAARAACAEAMSSLVIMYALAGLRAPALELVARASGMIDPEEDSDVAAHGALRMAESMLTNMLLPDPARALRLADEGISAFRMIGDRRQEGLCRVACSEALYSLGELERGEREMREALQLGKLLAEPLVEILAQLALGLHLALYGDASEGVEAEQLVTAVYEDPRLTTVYRGHALSALTGALLAQGRAREAEARAREALAIFRAAPAYAPRALALLIMSLRAQGRAAESVPFVNEGMRVLASLGGAGRTELMFLLAAVEVWVDLGKAQAAREVLGESLRQLQLRAGRIQSPELRRSFLTGERTHVRLQELAQRLLPERAP